MYVIVCFVILLTAATTFGIHLGSNTPLISLINEFVAIHSKNLDQSHMLKVEKSNFQSGGQLIGRYQPKDYCIETVYKGVGTKLYTDRFYFIKSTVRALKGHHFCKTRRHNLTYVILKVEEPTIIYAFGTESLNLELSGWKTYLQLAVPTDGVLKFDQLYKKKIKPGIYFINHGFNSTVIPVFWNHDHVKLITSGILK